MTGFRKARSFKMTLRGSPEQVFPLLCPIREEGKQFVRDLDDEGFHARMAMVEKMLDHYLMTGVMLKI